MAITANEARIRLSRDLKKKEINDAFAQLACTEAHAINVFGQIANLGQYQTKKAELEAYQACLLKEVDTLPINYDHPVLAAQALLKVSEQYGKNGYLQAIANFTTISQNSCFHPNARAMGKGIATFLLYNAIPIGLLIGVVSALSLGMVPAAVVGAIAFGTALFGVVTLVALPLIYWVAENNVDEKKREYRPIINSITLGGVIAVPMERGLKSKQPEQIEGSLTSSFSNSHVTSE